MIRSGLPGVAHVGLAFFVAGAVGALDRLEPAVLVEGTGPFVGLERPQRQAPGLAIHRDAQARSYPLTETLFTFRNGVLEIYDAKD